MINKFTDKARKVLICAQEEAIKLGHQYIGTEHLLIGLLKEETGIAAKVLSALNVDLAEIYSILKTNLTPTQTPNADFGYTPRAKKVIELALEEAAQLGHNYVGTEHILLGLLREEESFAAQILINIVDIATLKRQVLELLGETRQYSKQEYNQMSNDSNRQSTTSTPLLDEFGTDLNKLALERKLDPVIGRQTEIERVVQILLRRTKNNPVLIGEPGVGKTAIAEGLANKIIEKQVPEFLTDKRIISLSIASMVAGTKYRGEFEERMKKMLEELKNSPDIILFIDELHTLIGAGASEGAIDAANIIKPLLTRGEIQVIGATTLNEYKKYIEKDSALERRFQPIMVNEPTVEDSIKILKGIRDKYEAFHRAKITDEALEASVKLSHRYISDRFLPDKAIDLMDEATSKVRLASFKAPPAMKETEEKLEKIRTEKESAISAQEFERAASLRDLEKELREELKIEQDKWKVRENDLIVVNEEDIAQVVSNWTGIPVKQLEEAESERLLKLEEILHERVIGQEDAVKAVAKAVKRARAGLKDPKKPIGSFIFLGPTGVGKTELAKALANALFGEDTAMVRLDMSEYMEKHTVSRLVGAPPGYVGYEEGGQLTDIVRRKPYSVILLDEIEKAHPDVFNILLQVLDDGRLTDSQGRTVDFKNTVIIMTSNVGSQLLKKDNLSLGFMKSADAENEKAENIKMRIQEEVKRTFRPEFLNRIDDIIIFNSLTEKELSQIIDIMLKDVESRLKELELSLEVSESAKKELLNKGFDNEFGARPLKRAIQRNVEDEISEMILKSEINKGDIVLVDTDTKGNLELSKK